MKRIYSCSLSTLIILGTTAALAASKTVPTSACQTLDGRDARLARSENEITSIGSDFTISCPILRDNTTNTNGLSALQLRVKKADTATRSCTAYASDGFGSQLKSVTKTVSGTGVQPFDWGTTFNVSSANGANYAVVCTLGAEDFGEGIYWTETNGVTSPDTKILPGAACKPASKDDVLYRNGLGAVWGESTFGTNPGPVLMQCPMTRDVFSTSTTLRSVNVRMFHQDAIKDADCFGVVADSATNVVKSVDKPVTSIGWVNLDWGTSLNVASAAGYYDLECALGASDVIFSYSWGE